MAHSPAALAQLLDLLDYLPDTVAFIKDRQGRYRYANQTLVKRLRLPAASALIGKQAAEVFPAALGITYTRQDHEVLAGRPLTEHLELHLYPGGQTGWCLTTKRPLTENGETTGLVGLSRDLHLPRAQAEALARAVDALHARHAEPLSVRDLARHADLSVSSFERQIKRVYGLTPTQLLTRVRLDSATHLLRHTAKPVAEIAVECGYFDHSAFTRTFKTVVGLTPTQFRQLSREW